MTELFDLVGWNNPRWREKKALILGAGESAFAAADTLTELGVKVSVLADDVPERLAPLFDVIGAELRLNVDENQNLDFVKAFDPDFAVISPSFSRESKIVQGLTLRQNPVWSEAELGWRLRDKYENPAQWIQITGSASIRVLEIIAPVLAAAEIGYAVYGLHEEPILNGIRGPEQPQLFFLIQDANQLSSLFTSSPMMSLYVDGDGNSWHEQEHDAVSARGRVFQNTQEFALYPVQDDFGEFLLERADVVEGCRAIGYSLVTPEMSQIGIVEDLVVDRAFIENRRDHARELCTLEEVQTFGVSTHKELSELLAGLTLLRALGVSDDLIRHSLFGL